MYVLSQVDSTLTKNSEVFPNRRIQELSLLLEVPLIQQCYENPVNRKQSEQLSVHPLHV